MVSTVNLGPEEWVVLLDDDAVPLRWAARARTLWLRRPDGDRLISYCALAHSLRVFGGASGEMAAVLPHGAGFFIGQPGMLWDGGTGLGQRMTALVPHPFVLCRASELPSSALVRLPAGEVALPTVLKRTPRLPGARGIEGAMDWGVVQNGRWVACREPRVETDWTLSRWAAKVLLDGSS